MSKQVIKDKGNKSYHRSSLKAGLEKESIKQNRPQEYPRSYRFDSEIMSVLKDTLNKINAISPKKVSEARLIKALIWISKKIDKEEILKNLKEVW